MYWSDVGYLCTPIKGRDKFNRPTNEDFDKHFVICNIKGVKRTEFYQAQSVGYKPALTVEIMGIDYQGERYFETVDGDMYKVLRTYPVKDERIELVCEGMTAGNG